MRHLLKRIPATTPAHAPVTRTCRRALHPVAAALLAIPLVAAPASAQFVGTFSWQAQPYCNVITVSVTQLEATYRLEGVDDQCGGAVRASVIGTAFANPDGTIGLGFNVVATPGGAPLHLDATISLPSGSGTWRDSAGNAGSFLLAPVLPAAGSPRPLGGIGLGAIDTSEVQQRVAGTCGPGEAIRTINQDGTVVCAAGTGATSPA